jgi:hypothetical protein
MTCNLFNLAKLLLEKLLLPFHFVWACYMRFLDLDKELDIWDWFKQPFCKLILLPDICPKISKKLLNLNKPKNPMGRSLSLFLSFKLLFNTFTCLCKRKQRYNMTWNTLDCIESLSYKLKWLIKTGTKFDKPLPE